MVPWHVGTDSLLSFKHESNPAIARVSPITHLSRESWPVLWILRNWRRKNRLQRSDTSAAGWHHAFARTPLLQALDADESQRLRELATLFLYEKSLEPVQGMELDSTRKQVIALQACLPVLNLGFDWLERVISVVIYPDTFMSEVTEHDPSGIVHSYREARSGESWDQGPLILAWSDIEADTSLDGHNVILHEIAHKLDALDGSTNGKPPLPRGMPPQEWVNAFSEAFSDFSQRIASGEETMIDPYAGESPAEFFAVLSEAFFETPRILDAEYPRIYAQLANFYQQDTLSRFAKVMDRMTSG
jgi:MtfA peptidase